MTGEYMGVNSSVLQKKKPKDTHDNAQYNKQAAALRQQFRDAGKPENLQELLLRAAAVYGERTQVVEFAADGNKTYSAKCLCDDAAAIAASLNRLKLQGKNIGIIGRNGYAWMAAFFAVACGVGTAVPLDKELHGQKLKMLIEKADIALILYDDMLMKTVCDAAGAIPCIPFVGKKEDEISLLHLIRRGRALLADDAAAFFRRKVNADDVAAIVFTSGTTGANKGVMLTHGNLVENAFSLSGVLPPMASALSVLPMNHVFELGCTVLTAVTINGVLYINDSLRNLLKNVVACQPQMIVVVPAFIDYLYKEIDTQLKKNGFKSGMEGFAGAALPIRAVIKKAVASFFGGQLPFFACGGAAVRKEYLQAMQSLGFEIFLGYGLSESAPIAALNMHADKKPEAVGSPISSDSCFRIHAPDADGIGEIMLCGKNICAGYYNDEKSTAASFSDGWFYTGDYGKIDADGNLYITGRKKNLIVLDNGKNICPEEIENHLLANVKGLREAVVFESIKRFGETDNKIIAAAVYVNPADFPDIAPTHLAHKIKEAVVREAFKLPAFMRLGDAEIFTSEFPKTTTLKIIRQSVIEQYNKRKEESEHA